MIHFVFLFQTYSTLDQARWDMENRQQEKASTAVERRLESTAEEIRMRSLIVELDHALHELANYEDANRHCHNVKLERRAREASQRFLKGIR